MGVVEEGGKGDWEVFLMVNCSERPESFEVG